MTTTWYVVFKKVGEQNMFISKEDSQSNGSFTHILEDAETYPMSDYLRETCEWSGGVPVPADFFGIEV